MQRLPKQLTRTRCNFLKLTGVGVAASTMMSITHTPALAQTAAHKSTLVEGADNFYKSDKVTLQKVTFKNQLNMLWEIPSFPKL